MIMKSRKASEVTQEVIAYGFQGREEQTNIETEKSIFLKRHL